jgi:hypothetical protein
MLAFHEINSIGHFGYDLRWAGRVSAVSYSHHYQIGNNRLDVR